MNSEPNWAEVDGEAEMDYSHRPTLLPKLGSKIGSSLPETPEIDDPDIDTSDPAIRTFLNSLPNNGPYRIMITNLPQNITQESLESTLTTDYRITATIRYKPGVPYCFLNFDNRNHCLESTSLFGARIHGAAVKLKVNPSDQQAEIRRANTATRNSGSSRSTLSGSTGGRFKNLARDSSGTSLRTTKHRHPVGGSIRKKRSNARNNQSSSQSKQPTNPWNSESRNQPKSDYKILARRKQPAPNSNRRFDRGASSGASSAPSRQRDDMRAPRRQDNFRDRRDRGGREDRRDNRDNRDDAFSFRNRREPRREDDIPRQREPRREDDGPRRRKLRDDDGRADGALNWRSNTTNTPTRPRVDRRDPGREVNTDSNFSRRALNSTPRRTPAQKDKEKDAPASKNRFANKFDLLAEDED